METAVGHHTENQKTTRLSWRRLATTAGRLFAFTLPWLLLSCSTLQQRRDRRAREHAFVSYQAPPPGDSHLRLAVKDIIDVRGLVTTAGSEYLAKTRPPAARDAACLGIARERGAMIVGKTNMTEFAVTVSGKNHFFGTPRNRFDGKHERIPGGSSSGSAVAVKTGMADVAFGTDTAGSIRTPAACCGVYGLKTTFGLVPQTGVFPVSPQHLDTVGPMAADLPRLVEGMDLLQRGFRGRYRQAVGANPSGSGIRVGRLYLDGTDPEIDQAIDRALADAGFQVVRLDARFKAQWVQAQRDGKTVAAADAWLNNRGYADQEGVHALTKAVFMLGEIEYPKNYREALSRRPAWQATLRDVFTRVDFIALPTLQRLPPRFPFFGSSAVFEMRVFDMQNTVAVNFAGNPAVAIPLKLPRVRKAVPVTSLQLIGPFFSEPALLNAARLVDQEPPR
jgi:Asp-tRNA(Asn)/Glu-tRNA(Gln) amidotransferase A subunit family amidase